MSIDGSTVQDEPVHNVMIMKYLKCNEGVNGCTERLTVHSLALYIC